MNHRRVAAAALALLVVGCTATADSDDGPRVLQPGAPGEPTRELSPEEVAALDLGGDHSEADVTFTQGMIPHHAQALSMTQLVVTNSSNDRLGLLSERMDISQRDEIDLITAWLEERGEEVPSLLWHHHDDHHEDHDVLMPGMLTNEQFAQLEAAEGEEFDRLFLLFMIDHHLGAIEMVERLYADDSGIDPEVSSFANHVLSDQQIEISRMQELLAELEGS